MSGGGGGDLQTFALRVTGSIPNPVQILMRGRGGWSGGEIKRKGRGAGGGEMSLD